MFLHLFWIGPLGELSNPNNPTSYPIVDLREIEELANQWDVLGLSPPEFLEIISTTSTRITQVGFASWSNFNPVARVTQVDFSSWSFFNPEARITQINVSVWRTTDDKLRRLVNVYFV